MKEKHHYMLWAVMVLVLILMVAYSGPLADSLSDPAHTKQRVLALGVLAPVAIIVFMIISVIIAPVPGFVVAPISGYIFGVWLGFLYAFIGKVIGTFILFQLARKWEKPAIIDLVEHHEHHHFNLMYEKRGMSALIPMYILPLFPVDTVTMLAGLTDIDSHKFFLISSLCFIPKIFLLSFFGDTLTGQNSILMIIIGVLVTILLLIFIFRHQIKMWLIKEIHHFEHKKNNTKTKKKK